MTPEEPQGQNPYAAPRVDVDVPETATEEEVPFEVMRKIRGAWIAGCITTTLTLAFGLFTLSVPGGQAIAIGQLVAAAIIGVLAFGIYKRSRTCAVLMVVLFVFDRWYMFQGTSFRVLPVLVACIFVYYYVNGAIGTFEYHKHMDAHPSRGRTSGR